MSFSAFIASYEQLPDTLPVFPLPGTILMPGNELPLNVFEPRYLNMVSDALGSHHMIGIIQPDPNSKDDSKLSHTGCAGRITQYRETSDGRIEMVLVGVCRFDPGEELPTTRGYRLIVPQWSRFKADYSEHDGGMTTAHDLLLQTLKAYFRFNDLDVDWKMLERLSTVRLINSLSMALPLGEADKQLLLETVQPAERLETFIALLNSESRSPGSATRH
ncbi:MAG: LON peptidase substrate-binding domain-containing protein [Gammaproteobacteria bacterium]